MTEFQKKVAAEVKAAVNGIHSVDDCYCKVDVPHYVWCVVNNVIPHSRAVDQYIRRGEILYDGKAQFRFGGKSDELDGQYRLKIYDYSNEEWCSLVVPFGGLAMVLKDYCK